MEILIKNDFLILLLLSFCVFCQTQDNSKSNVDLKKRCELPKKELFYLVKTSYQQVMANNVINYDNEFSSNTNCEEIDMFVCRVTVLNGIKILGTLNYSSQDCSIPKTNLANVEQIEGKRAAFISMEKYDQYEVLFNPNLLKLFYSWTSPEFDYDSSADCHLMPPRAVIAEKPSSLTNYQVTFVGRFNPKVSRECRFVSVKERDDNGTLNIYYGLYEVKYIKYVRILFVLNTKAPRGVSVNPIFA